MALSLIKRVVTRTISEGSTLEKNDLQVFIKKTGGDLKDMIRLSEKAFKELGLSNKGASFLFDDETNKVYLAVLDEENAEVLKGRKDPKGGTFDKGLEFMHLQIISSLETIGSIPKERPAGFKAGFKLVPTELEFEGVDKIYEILPDELKGRGAGKSEDTTSQSEVPAESAVIEEDVEEEWPEA